jgi:plastocyanin
MHLSKSSTVGLTVAALAVIALGAFALITRADAHSPSQDIRECMQERRESGYFDHTLTREERRAVRLEFRMCIREAVFHNHNSSSSSSKSSTGSSVSSSSTSTSSSTGSSVSSSTTSSSSHTSHMSSSKSSKSKSSKSSVVKVEIEDFEYYPATVNIKTGTTVRWENEDEAPHTVTSNNTGGVLNSGTLDEDETYSYTFTNTGSYSYHCSFHPSMVGTVNVSN